MAETDEQRIARIDYTDPDLWLNEDKLWLISKLRERSEDTERLNWICYTGHGFVKGTDVSKWTIEAPHEGIRTIRQAVDAARAGKDQPR